MTAPDNSAVVFVQRDAHGAIEGLTRRAPTLQEQASGTWQMARLLDEDVQVFLMSTSTSAQDLDRTDLGFIRVLEDLIDVLIGRGLIQFTDLPAPAQSKLLERRALRQRLRTALDDLAPDEGPDLHMPGHQT